MEDGVKEAELRGKDGKTKKRPQIERGTTGLAAREFNERAQVNCNERRKQPMREGQMKRRGADCDFNENRQTRARAVGLRFVCCNGERKGRTAY